MELVEDCYVKEKNKFYRILLAKKRKEQDSSEFSKVEWEFGWLPLVKKDPVLKELLEDEKRHLEKMLSKNPQKVLEEKLERVKEGLGYYSS
jgi:possible S-adenosyl-L-methionine-dependent methyltransferase